jgi:DNA polymerase-3 subunit delta'
MTVLVLQAATRRQFDQFVQNPTHGILISGPAGIGKLTVAKHLAANIIGIDPARLESYAYFLLVKPEKQAVTIESIRQVSRFLQRKTIGEANIRRAVIIEDAHLMTLEAQNAFLKSLEEPPLDTVLILTASQPQFLLPTISSRVQTLAVHIPPKSELETFFAASAEFNRAYNLSGGLPGLTAALMSEDEVHPLYQAVIDAKSLLQKTTFERLALVDSLSRDKNNTSLLVEALERIVQTGLEQAAIKRQESALKRWQGLLETLVKMRSSIDKNANQRLALTYLFIHM